MAFLAASFDRVILTVPPADLQLLCHATWESPNRWRRNQLRMAKEVILLLPVQSTDRVLCSIVCFVKCLSSPKNQLEKIDVRPQVEWMGAAHKNVLL